MLLIGARLFRFSSMFTSELFPTLDRPMKTTSGIVGLGSVCIPVAFLISFTLLTAELATNSIVSWFASSPSRFIASSDANTPSRSWAFPNQRMIWLKWPRAGPAGPWLPTGTATDWTRRLASAVSFAWISAWMHRSWARRYIRPKVVTFDAALSSSCRPISCSSPPSSRASRARKTCWASTVGLPSGIRGETRSNTSRAARSRRSSRNFLTHLTNTFSERVPSAAHRSTIPMTPLTDFAPWISSRAFASRGSASCCFAFFFVLVVCLLPVAFASAAGAPNCW
mmetsp:Transcript_30856/g.75247  ORF Transcript_30856/g.75247 Transcript_30856/m.75247 type:complete len:282 (-) Transcript_30856:192-1037(-)